MIGSAAARHAAKNMSASSVDTPLIVLIGQSEPKDNAYDTKKRRVFGAHYDEGRITRRTDPDPIWAELASRSIKRYDEIRQESGNGIEFYCECGHLALGLEGSDTIERRKRVASDLGIDHATLDCAALHEQYPYLYPPKDCVGIHETSDSGYISARGLVNSQTMAADLW